MRRSSICISPEQVCPYPKAAAQTTKGRRNKGTSLVLTDTPTKIHLEMEDLKKCQAKEIKTEKHYTKNKAFSAETKILQKMAIKKVDLSPKSSEN